jgi:hypothetical protein
MDTLQESVCDFKRFIHNEVKRNNVKIYQLHLDALIVLHVLDL